MKPLSRQTPTESEDAEAFERIGTLQQIASEGSDLDAYCKWFDTVFLPSLPIPQERSHVVLLVDSHLSHLESFAALKANTNKVVVQKIPPNSTGYLQPLDVCFFSPMNCSSARKKELLLFVTYFKNVPLRFSPVSLEKFLSNPAQHAPLLVSAFKRSGAHPLSLDRTLEPLQTKQDEQRQLYESNSDDDSLDEWLEISDKTCT